MARVALLIGIGDYRAGLKPIPASSKDAGKFSHVLKSPQWGSFKTSQVLNESPVLRSHVTEELESWCHQHQPDDLALLYISGYLLWGEEEIYLATYDTGDEQGNLSPSRAVSFSLVQSCLQASAAQHQIVVLDGCVAEHGMSRSRGCSGKLPPLQERSLDLEQHLGSEGRLILAAANHGRYLSTQKQRSLSTYTRFCMEGTRSGLADRNQDGHISPRELHDYVKAQMAIATPAIAPVLIGDETLADSLSLFNSPASKSHQEYGNVVRHLLQRHGYESLRTQLNGSSRQSSQFSNQHPTEADQLEIDHSSKQQHSQTQPLSQILLSQVQQQLDLRDEAAEQLQEAILGSYEHFQNSQLQYQTIATQLMPHDTKSSDFSSNGSQPQSLEVEKAMNSDTARDRQNGTSSHESNGNLNEEILQDGSSSYESDGDSNEKIARDSGDSTPNGKPLNEHPSDPLEHRENNSSQHSPSSHPSEHNGFAKPPCNGDSISSPLSITDLSQLENLRDRLGLEEKDVASVDQGIDYIQHLKRLENYRQVYRHAVETQQLSDEACQADLAELQNWLQLSDEDVEPVQEEFDASKQVQQQKLEQYRITFSEAVNQGIVQHSWIQDALKHFQHHLGLSDADVERIETEVQHHMKGANLFTSNPEPDPESQDDRSKRLQTYRQAYADVVRQQIPIPSHLQTELNQLQQQLQLSDDDVQPIQHELVQTIRAEIQERFRKLDDYQQAFEQSVEEKFPLSSEQRDRLDNLRQSFNLTANDVRPIEEMVEHQWQSQHQNETGAPHLPSDQEGETLQTSPETDASQNGFEQEAHGPSDIDPAELNGESAPPPPNSQVSPSQTEVPEDEAQLSAEHEPSHDSLQPAMGQPTFAGLSSERAIDYKLLEQQLKNKQWLEADEETRRILVELGKSDSHTADWLDYRAIAILPATDLHTIDRLWVEHSRGKFGFSVQANVYFDNDPDHPVVKGNPITFGKQVEWVQFRRSLFGFKFYKQLKFQLLRAPDGHLPAKWFWDIPWWESLRLGGIGTGRGGCGNDDGLLFAFMSKLVTCGVTTHRDETW